MEILCYKLSVPAILKCCNNVYVGLVYYQIAVVRQILRKELGLKIVEVGSDTAVVEGGDVLWTGRNSLCSVNLSVELSFFITPCEAAQHKIQEKYTA